MVIMVYKNFLGASFCPELRSSNSWHLHNSPPSVRAALGPGRNDNGLGLRWIAKLGHYGCDVQL